MTSQTKPEKKHEKKTKKVLPKKIAVKTYPSKHDQDAKEEIDRKPGELSLNSCTILRAKRKDVESISQEFLLNLHFLAIPLLFLDPKKLQNPVDNASPIGLPRAATLRQQLQCAQEFVLHNS